MTRQSAAVRSARRGSIMAPADPAAGAMPTDRWYQREDPYTTAVTDAAFARFMAGDNPHLRTDEVPVVDFTDMIEAVGPDGRALSEASQRHSRLKLGLVALATTALLALAAVFGVIDIPGVDRLGSDAVQSTVPASTPDTGDGVVGETVDAQSTQPGEAPEVLSSNPDGTGTSIADEGEQPLNIDSGN